MIQKYASELDLHYYEVRNRQEAPWVPLGYAFNELIAFINHEGTIYAQRGVEVTDLAHELGHRINGHFTEPTSDEEDARIEIAAWKTAIEHWGHKDWFCLSSAERAIKHYEARLYLLSKGHKVVSNIRHPI